ncbi:MAG TPA: hypothetical protein DCW29_08190 [Janthinobacterium sp.]|nr:hypothetical protein [Janthinobacterium sp.]
MYRYAAIAALTLVGGCATLTESNQQTLTVQTIEDHHAVAGVGCILANDVGKWFIMAPGRVTIQKSAGRLRVDCRKDSAGSASEEIASKVDASLWGNVVLTLGLGYLVDRQTGAGFDYPDTLTIEMKNGAAAPAAAPSAGSLVY